MDTALHDLFIEELGDIYDAEHQLTKALPELAKVTKSDELRKALEDHLSETKEHISRLVEVFELMAAPAKKKKCNGIAGLIQEGEQLMKSKKDSAALDAALVASAQKTEHYEIASYGTLCRWAEIMGHTQALNLLKANLAEEKNADEKLTKIAETVANPEGQAKAK